MIDAGAFIPSHEAYPYLDELFKEQKNEKHKQKPNSKFTERIREVVKIIQC